MSYWSVTLSELCAVKLNHFLFVFGTNWPLMHHCHEAKHATVVILFVFLFKLSFCYMCTYIVLCVFGLMSNFSNKCYWLLSSVNRLIVENHGVCDVQWYLAVQNPTLRFIASCLTAPTLQTMWVILHLKSLAYVVVLSLVITSAIFALSEIHGIFYFRVVQIKTIYD